MAGSSQDNSEWYFSKKEIEENSPSRGDGIDAKTENDLRKAYSLFLLELGTKLKLPQITVTTAIVFCHRFFLRQSHAKNDKNTIAVACMHLAAKVEETRPALRDMILVSGRIILRDASAVERLKCQDQAYEQSRKKLILSAEKFVLATLGFDTVVHDPFRPLTEAMKKLNVEKKIEVFQVAWNFVRDGLRTSLCLQFRAPHLAATVIFLASKYVDVKLLPLDWLQWPEFNNVTGRQVKEVCDQLLDLYEESLRSKLKGSNGGEGTSEVVSDDETDTASSSAPERSRLEFLVMLRNSIQNCDHDLEQQLQQSLVESPSEDAEKEQESNAGATQTN